MGCATNLMGLNLILDQIKNDFLIQVIQKYRAKIQYLKALFRTRETTLPLYL